MPDVLVASTVSAVMPKSARGVPEFSANVRFSPPVDVITRLSEPSISAETPEMPFRAASNSACVLTSPEPPSAPNVMVVAAPEPTEISKLSPFSTPNVLVAVDVPAVMPRFARGLFVPSANVRSSPLSVVITRLSEPSTEA